MAFVFRPFLAQVSQGLVGGCVSPCLPAVLGCFAGLGMEKRLPAQPRGFLLGSTLVSTDFWTQTAKELIVWTYMCS